MGEICEKIRSSLMWGNSRARVLINRKRANLDNLVIRGVVRVGADEGKFTIKRFFDINIDIVDEIESSVGVNLMLIWCNL